MIKNLVIVLAVLILGGGALILMNASDDDNTNTNSSQTPNLTSETTETDSNLVQQTIESGGQLIDYTPGLLAQSDAETNILFFHADWCSICNAVERNLRAGNIPEGMTILKVDYESSDGRQLAEQYNIPIQYSMVQVDRDGNQITQWVNQSFYTIENVLEQIQST
ncbi:MAG: hypothetical protein R3313_03425 [Candidatus Saccharimonadales bacterium]|nr:hypothetical protein [Candidatus Saccharimonadales bacterium]